LARCFLTALGRFPPDAAERMVLAQRFAEASPPAHLQFLRNLERSFSCGDFFFVHAGVRPGVPLSHQVSMLMKFDLHNRVMPVYDNLSESLFAVEKFVADPEQGPRPPAPL
jgi:hypothetical protein